MVALTATATERVTRDIAASLHLKNARIIKKSFHRANLAFRVRYPRSEPDKEMMLLELLADFRNLNAGKCIIYCSTRSKVDRLYDLLKSQSFRVGKYHAGRSNGIREKTQDSYSFGKINILVATNAFGMGMDEPNVRLVLHYQVPGSVESYFQEAGRAGRDGQNSQCILFHTNADFVTQNFILSKDGNQETGQLLLKGMRDYGESSICRQKFLCNYFGEAINDCGNCDVCLGNHLQVQDLAKQRTEREIEKAAKSSYAFSKDEIEWIHSALRIYPGVFGKKIIVGILRGSKSRDIKKYRLEKSDVYAKLSNIPAEAIGRFLQEGVETGAIKIAGAKYPKIFLSTHPPRSRAEKALSSARKPVEAKPSGRDQ